MRELIVFTLVLCQGMNTLMFIPHYKTAGCGEEIQTDRGMYLPARAKCAIPVLAQPGFKTVVDIFYKGTALDCYETPNAIQIVDENGESESACAEGGSFLATSLQNFFIQVDDLPHGIKMHVTYVRPEYKCEETIAFNRMVGVPFIFEKNSAPGEPCALIVPSGVHLEMRSIEYKADECEVRAEVNQGRGLRMASISTGEVCIGKEPVKTEIYCGFGWVSLHGPTGSRVQITMIPPTKQENEGFEHKKSLCTYGGQY